METERGADGRFVQPRLSPERARELQKRSVEVQKAKRGISNETGARKILQDFGLEWDEAEESIRILARDASGGNVTAHRLLLDRLGRLKSTKGPEYDPTSGQPCPTCGGQVLIISMTADDYSQFQKTLSSEE